MEGGLPLALEGDNDETDKDVDHEEGDDDEIDEVEEEDPRPVVLLGADVRLVRVNGHIQDPAEITIIKEKYNHFEELTEKCNHFGIYYGKVCALVLPFLQYSCTLCGGKQYRKHIISEYIT